MITCERCLGSGRIWHEGAKVQIGSSVVLRHSWRWDYCSCPAGQEERERMIVYHRKNAGIPPEYDRRFDDLGMRDLSPQQRGLWKAARRFVMLDGELSHGEHVYRGLCAYGMVGTGKSTLIGCVANELIARLGRAARWRSMSSLTREVRRFERLGGREETDALEYLYSDLQRVPILIVDDIGQERDTKLVHEALYTILEYRLAYGAGDKQERRFPLITLLTSNLTPSQLQNWDPTLASRLLQMCVFLAHNKESTYLRKAHIIN